MNYNPMDLSGRRVLITGASSGIGRACAIEAARLGASVALVARNHSALRETAALMERTEDHRFYVYDLLDLDGVAALFDKVLADGKLSGVVHSAGVCPIAPITIQSVFEMQSTCTLNFLSFLAMAKCFSKKKYMDGGSVVAISSVAAEAGWAGGVLYSGTKGALSASVRALAVELVSKGIRVNTVQPSNIKTPMYDAVAGNVNDDAGLSELCRKQPLGIGTPENVAHAVCFLLSSAASFITGTNLVVDGGYLAQ